MQPLIQVRAIIGFLWFNIFFCFGFFSFFLFDSIPFSLTIIIIADVPLGEKQPGSGRRSNHREGEASDDRQERRKEVTKDGDSADKWYDDDDDERSDRDRRRRGRNETADGDDGRGRNSQPADDRELLDVNTVSDALL